MLPAGINAEQFDLSGTHRSLVELNLMFYFITYHICCLQVLNGTASVGTYEATLKSATYVNHRSQPALFVSSIKLVIIVGTFSSLPI